MNFRVPGGEQAYPVATCDQALGLAQDGWDLALSYWWPYDDRLGYERSPDDPETIAETIRIGINSTNEETRVSQMMAFGRDGVLDDKQRSQLADMVDRSGSWWRGSGPYR